MTDLEFHTATCSACQRGKPCGTATRMPRTLRDSTKPLLIASEQGPKPSMNGKDPK